jgi:mannose-6-phosphate isomerase-like protein (cupin superfamily)
MRSGRVSLKAGEAVGEHSTGRHEEIVIVLEGRGVACTPGCKPLPLEAGQAVYVPPHTTHNMKNLDATVFQYIYVVAPVSGPEE